MPVSKKQLVRLIRLVAQLKENRYPNCARFAEEMRQADLDENLNLACTPKTIFRDIQTLKLKILGTFNITREPTLSIKSGNFYRTVVTTWRDSAF